MAYRKLDLSKFNAGESDDEETFIKPAVKLDSNKAKTFIHGIQKKSKKDLEKEAEKRKKEQEEEDNARVFAEFSADFADDGPSTGSFGRSDGRPGGSRGGFVRASGSGSSNPSPYNFNSRYPSNSGGGGSSYENAAVSGPSGPRSSRPRSPSPERPTKAGGKKKMNSFLEELKRDQAIREAGGRSELAPDYGRPERGSHPTGDPTTSNLYVGNLPANVTENTLGMLFAKYGPVGSVKIMYPRGEELTRAPKTSLSGFVAYMKRRDAETGLRELDGLQWGESVLKVGWSKAVPTPNRPLYVVEQEKRHRSRSRSRSRSPKRHHRRERSYSPDDRRYLPSRSHDNYNRPPAYRKRSGSYSSPSRSPSPPPRSKSGLPDVKPETEKFIKTVSEKILQHGKSFEDMLKEREKNNPKFEFLWNKNIQEYHFFRSCLDPRYRLPTPTAPDFTDEGYNSIYSADSAEESEREHVKKGKLGKLAGRRFKSMLRGMTGKRGDIALLMQFAIERADAAEEIVHIITQSLIIFSTPIPIKIARFYLISDILSNSAAPLPNAWKYRGEFEKKMVQVFDHFGELYNSFKIEMGRMSAETFRGQVNAVLDVLETWIVFNPSFLEDLRHRLSNYKSPEDLAAERNEAQPIENDSKTLTDKASSIDVEKAFQSKFKKTGFSSAQMVEAEEDDMDGAPMDDLDGAPMDDDVDGVPMGVDDDLDGAPM